MAPIELLECNKPKKIPISKGKHTLTSRPDNGLSLSWRVPKRLICEMGPHFPHIVKDFGEICIGILLKLHLVRQHRVFALTEKLLGL